MPGACNPMIKPAQLHADIPEIAIPFKKFTKTSIAKLGNPADTIVDRAVPKIQADISFFRGQRSAKNTNANNPVAIPAVPPETAKLLTAGEIEKAHPNTDNKG